MPEGSRIIHISPYALHYCFFTILYYPDERPHRARFWAIRYRICYNIRTRRVRHIVRVPEQHVGDRDCRSVSGVAAWWLGAGAYLGPLAGID